MYSNIHRIAVSVGLAMLMLIAGCGGGDSPVDPGNGGSEAAPLEFSDLNPRPVRGEFRSVHSAGGTSVAVGDDGVIAVRPAGESAWVNATSSNVENFTAVEMLDEQFGVAVGEDGGWDTVDGGRTWNRADEVRGMRDIALRAGVGVMVGGSKVLRSLDLDTWNTSTHDEFDFQSIDFAHDGLLYGVGFGTLARSTNLGQNWIPVTGPPGINSFFHVAFMNAVEGIVAERQRLWLTTDGGISWLDVLTLPSEIRNLQLEDDGTGFVMTADGEIFRGSNRGRDWTRIATELGKPFSETMYARGAIEWILVGENGFVAETKDAGASLQVASSGIRFNMAEPSFASPQVGVSLGYPVDSGPLIGRTTDGGVSWNFEPSPLLQPVALEFLDSSIGVLLDESGLVMRSTNQGLSWTDASPIAQFTSFHRLALLDARTWLACGENSAIQRTEDAGQNWRIVNADLDGGLPLFDLDFFPDTSVGLAINPDGVFRSEDAGRSWGALEEDLSWGGGKRIVCLDQQTAISGFHEIVRTTDQGRSWITVFTPANTIRDIAFFDALHGIAVDSGGIHVETLDGGLSWRPARAAFDVISGVAFRDQNSTVSVGEGGTMILGSRPRGR